MPMDMLESFSRAKHGGCGQVVKAEACGASIRGFEPRHPPYLSALPKWQLRYILGCHFGIRAKGNARFMRQPG